MSVQKYAADPNMLNLNHEQKQTFNDKQAIHIGFLVSILSLWGITQ